jgi:hypothetical protein
VLYKSSGSIVLGLYDFFWVILRLYILGLVQAPLDDVLWRKSMFRIVTKMLTVFYCLALMATTQWNCHDMFPGFFVS